MSGICRALSSIFPRAKRAEEGKEEEARRSSERSNSHLQSWASKTERAESVSTGNLAADVVRGAKSGLCLAADVGGTNSRFMLYLIDLTEAIRLRREAPGNLIFERKYANICFGSFADVVQAFYDDANASEEVERACPGGIAPEVACFAVAGVAQQNMCRLTNLDWVISGSELEERFRIAVVEIINDFVAQGYGVLTLGDDEVIQLAGPQPMAGAPIACVGAGTGLGQCFLVSGTTGEYQAYPSEGGHAEFAPRGAGNDETQMELLKYLKVKFSGWNRISQERVVSGKGICNIYEFLAYSDPTRIEKEVHKQFLANRQDAGIVAKNAEPGTLCHEALRIFASCYGAVSGTYALQVMPFGGLYLSGGVTQKLQSFLREDESFLDAYFDKGRVSPMLQDVPLFFVKGDEMGQRGAHLRAVRLLHHHRKGLMVPESASDATKVHLAPPRDVKLKELLKDLPIDGMRSRGHISPPPAAPSPHPNPGEVGLVDVTFTPVNQIP